MIKAHLVVMMVHGIQKVNIVQCNNHVKEYAYIGPTIIRPMVSYF